MKTGKTLILLAAWMFAAPAFAQVDLDAYLKRDRYERMKISPTGEYMAVTVPLEDRTVLAILRLSDKVITAKAMAGENSLVDDFWWANDERVVVAMAQQLGSQDAPYATGELHAVNADGSRPMLLASPYGIPDSNLGIGGTIRLTLEAAVFLIDPLANDDRNVLVAAMPISTDPQTRVEKLDIYNRRRTPVASAPVRNASFTADVTGEVRFARGSGYDNVSKLYYRDARGQDWR
ncbi:MAG TPA: S9 family peptidase, partial [Pseudoxanthomonas sp.]|nr:S9 family peptidase [Pseudoxanthomonas sp.]